MNLLPVKYILLVTRESKDETIRNILRMKNMDEESGIEAIIDNLIGPGSGVFAPVVKGTIEEDGGETLIRAKMRVSNSALIFFAVWTLGFGWWSMEAFSSEANDESYDSYPFIPLAMILVYYCIMTAYFNMEARRMERMLKEATGSESIKRIS